MGYPEAITRHELSILLVRKGVCKYSVERALDMVTHVLEDRGGSMSAVTDIVVTSDYWPSSGAIVFTRMLDNQKFKAYLKNKRFLVEKI